MAVNREGEECITTPLLQRAAPEDAEPGALGAQPVKLPPLAKVCCCFGSFGLDDCTGSQGGSQLSGQSTVIFHQKSSDDVC